MPINTVRISKVYSEELVLATKTEQSADVSDSGSDSESSQSDNSSDIEQADCGRHSLNKSNKKSSKTLSGFILTIF